MDAANIITSTAPSTAHFLVFTATTLIVFPLSLEGGRFVPVLLRR